jgi:hypothetical protein
VSFVGFVATAVGRGQTVVVSSYRRPVVNAAEGRNPPKAA